MFSLFTTVAMDMMAAKEAIAEEEDDDVPGKQSVFEISERISCCWNHGLYHRELKMIVTGKD